MLIQEETEIELDVDSKCALEEEGEKLKVEGTSQVVREGLVGFNFFSSWWMFSIGYRPVVFLSLQRFSMLKSYVNCLFLSLYSLHLHLYVNCIYKLLGECWCIHT